MLCFNIDKKIRGIVMKSIDLVIDLANESADKVTRAANEVITKAGKASQKFADKIDEKGKQLSTAERRLLKESRACVRNYPFSSLGIAFGVGFLLSKLLNNR
jgi:ElaB/YqjD/DUF883 family membrane-anchored ribosome-binding protein